MQEEKSEQPLGDGSDVNVNFADWVDHVLSGDDGITQDSTNDGDGVLSDVVTLQVEAVKGDVVMLASENSNHDESQPTANTDEQRPAVPVIARRTTDENAAENPEFAAEVGKHRGELESNQYPLPREPTKTPKISTPTGAIFDKTDENDQAEQYPYFALAIENREAQIDLNNLVLPDLSRSNNTTANETNLPDISLEEALANVGDDNPFYNAIKSGGFDADAFHQDIRNGAYDDVVLAMFPTIEDARAGNVVLDPMREIDLLLEEFSAQEQLRSDPMEVDNETTQNSSPINAEVFSSSSPTPRDVNRRRANTLPSDFPSSSRHSALVDAEITDYIPGNDEFIAAGRLYLQQKFGNSSSPLPNLSSPLANDLSPLPLHVKQWLDDRWMKNARSIEARDAEKSSEEDLEPLLEYRTPEEQVELMALHNLSPEEREKFDVLELFRPGVMENTHSIDDIFVPAPLLSPKWRGNRDFSMTNEDFDAQLDFFDNNDIEQNDSPFAEMAFADLVMENVDFESNTVVDNHITANSKSPNINVTEDCLSHQPMQDMRTARMASEDHTTPDVNSDSDMDIEEPTPTNSKIQEAAVSESDEPSALLRTAPDESRALDSGMIVENQTATNSNTPEIMVGEHKAESLPTETALEESETRPTTPADSGNFSSQSPTSFKTARGDTTATKDIGSDDEVSLIQTSPEKDLKATSSPKSAPQKTGAKTKSTKNVFAVVKAAAETPKKKRASDQTHSPTPGSSWSWGQPCDTNKEPRALQPAAPKPGDSESPVKQLKFTMYDPSDEIKPASRSPPKLKSTYKPRQVEAKSSAAASGPITQHQSQMLSSVSAMDQLRGNPPNVNVELGSSLQSQISVSSSFAYQSQGLSSNSLMGPVASTGHDLRQYWPGPRNRAPCSPQPNHPPPQPNNIPPPQRSNRPGLRNRHSIDITPPRPHLAPTTPNYPSPTRPNGMTQISPPFSPTQIRDPMSPTPIQRPPSTTASSTPNSLASNPNLPPRPDFHQRRAMAPRSTTTPRPDNTPLKLSIAQISPSKVKPREFATAVFGTVKKRENAVRIFEEEKMKTPKGKTMVIMENFKLKPMEITVSGPAGSNVRGFVMEIFRDAEVFATMMGGGSCGLA